MPSPLSMTIRLEIVRRHLDGQELCQIALELRVSYHTVRQIWRTFQLRGLDGMAPRYQRCGRPRPPNSVVARACEMKKLHPNWGAQLIRVELARELAVALTDLPAARTLQLAFRGASLQRPRRPGKPRTPPSDRATRVHEVWEADAVEKARMRNGHRASWLAVVDEAAGALLDLELSPPPAVARTHARRGPRAVPPRLRPLGAPRTPPGRQRPPLGLGRRSAHRSGVVADRAGGRPRLEPRATTLAQSQGRTEQRSDPAMGRDQRLSRPRDLERSPGLGRPDAA